MERNFALAGPYPKPHPQLIEIKFGLRVDAGMVDFGDTGIG